jgi:hypothetical protein
MLGRAITPHIQGLETGMRDYSSGVNAVTLRPLRSKPEDL